MNAFRPAVIVVVTAALVGCSAPGSSGVAASPAAEPSASAEPSIICEAFVAGGPVDDASDAAIATISNENPASSTRDAIDGFEDIADRAGPEEREDLEALADAMNTAAMSGEGYLGWSPAYEAFYVKYAEGCGREIAD